MKYRVQLKNGCAFLSGADAFKIAIEGDLYFYEGIEIISVINRHEWIAVFKDDNTTVTNKIPEELK